ncbi:MAG: carboxypeptidase regulatory-like domain-containing protein [Gemmatimonas sp.]
MKSDAFRPNFRFIPALVGAVLASALPALRPLSSQAAPVSTTAVLGEVRDSLQGGVLRGALVQLVNSEDAARFSRSVSSDSIGQFRFDSVPDGKYTLGFFHPILDSLGLQPLARAVTVVRQGALRADLALPGPKRFRDVVCGAKPSDGASGLVMGTVRDARTREPIKSALVTGQWQELVFSGGRMVPRTPRKISQTEDNGVFVLCEVPGQGTVMLNASRGADSTDFVEVEVPASGFIRRELFLTESRVVAAVDSAPKSDTLAFRNKTVRLGDARLVGSVISVESGEPVSGAVVAVTNGPQTRTNERGQFVLQNVAAGSRTVEVRAVGRVPVRRSVDVLEETAPVRIAMSTFKAVLDTLKVTAGLSSSLDYAEFEKRRATFGMGRFLTQSDARVRMAIETTEIFRNFPGLEVRANAAGGDDIFMKGVFDEVCRPAIWVNGTQMQNVSSGSLDVMVRPERIVGIEVYSPTSMPTQFQGGMTGCGAVVIWARN